MAAPCSEALRLVSRTLNPCTQTSHRVSAVPNRCPLITCSTPTVRRLSASRGPVTSRGSSGTTTLGAAGTCAGATDGVGAMVRSSARAGRHALRPAPSRTVAHPGFSSPQPRAAAVVGWAERHAPGSVLVAAAARTRHTGPSLKLPATSTTHYTLPDAQPADKGQPPCPRPPAHRWGHTTMLASVSLRNGSRNAATGRAV